MVTNKEGGIIDSFKNWMGNHAQLRPRSIDSYAGAIDTISKEMRESHVIDTPLRKMSLRELDIAIVSIFSNPQFIEKNVRGKGMYSGALQKFRYFMLTNLEREQDELIIVKEVSDSTLSKTEKEAIIKARLGQGRFRENLLSKYNGCCVITKIDLPKVLVASHIKPWAICGNEERIDTENGLLLSANMDKLFDCGLISFNAKNQLLISPFIGKENEERFNIKPRVSYDLKASPRMTGFLEYHRDVLFIK